jgi:DNA-binding protein HU-beta
MNKSELIEAVAAKTELTKAAAGRAVEMVLDTIAEAVAKGDSVSVIGFGSFRGPQACRPHRQESTHRREVLKIAATTVPAFKPGKAFKDRVAAGAGKKGGKKKVSRACCRLCARHKQAHHRGCETGANPGDQGGRAR